MAEVGLILDVADRAGGLGDEFDMWASLPQQVGGAGRAPTISRLGTSPQSRKEFPHLHLRSGPRIRGSHASTLRRCSPRSCPVLCAYSVRTTPVSDGLHQSRPSGDRVLRGYYRALLALCTRNPRRCGRFPLIASGIRRLASSRGTQCGGPAPGRQRRMDPRTAQNAL